MTEAAPRPRALPVLVVALAASVPFLVAAVVLHGSHWYPTGDLAQAEMRMRGFWDHPPLVGAAGRIAADGIQGSHPGPAMFWLAWPVYALLGRTAWAFVASCAVLEVGWVVAVAFAARRRGGWPVVLAVLAVCAVLAQSYGMSDLTQPWNPYMPLLPFLLFLVLVWGVFDGDAVLAPFAVAVGSFCIQCHVGYLGVVGLLLAASAGWLVWTRLRTAGRPEGIDGARPGRGLALVAVACVAVAAVVWLPPIIQQLTGDPGNFTIIYRYFSEPGEAVIGWPEGIRVTLRQLDPWGSWVTGRWDTTGTVVPGAVLVAAWAAVAVVGRRGDRRLRSLNLALVVALAGAVASAARIFGLVWGYLVEWMWSITALMVLSLAWGVVQVLRRPARLDRRAFAAVPAAVLVVATGFGIADGATVVPASPTISAQERVLAGQVLDRLPRDGTYVVDWADPLGLGGTGFGLMLEMERHGYDVGTLARYGTGVQSYRVVDPARADHGLVVATGYYAEVWRHQPGAEEIACADPRTPAERAEAIRLEEHLVDLIGRAGRPDLQRFVYANAIALALMPDAPPGVAETAKELTDLLQVAIVVEVPPDAMSISPEAVAAVEALPPARRLGSAPTCPR